MPFHAATPPHVLVLLGGSSAERDISLASGHAVEAALRAAGCSTQPLDPATDDVASYPFTPERDIVFLALHGEFGEDGQVQQLLDEKNVAYTGSGPQTSATAFSKTAAKEAFLRAGLPTPNAEIVDEPCSIPEAHVRATRIGYPLFVKPDRQGSSLGVTRVASPDGLEEAVRVCREFGGTCLLERAVDGTEWTLGLIDELVLPLIEIGGEQSFFDFNAKYHSPETEYSFDYDRTPAEVAAIAETGRRAAMTLGTSGMARVDLRVDEAGKPWLLEVNTIPGMTDHSLVPKAAARLGIPFSELCLRALDSAVTRWIARNNRPHAFIRREFELHRSAS